MLHRNRRWSVIAAALVALAGVMPAAAPRTSDPGTGSDLIVAGGEVSPSPPAAPDKAPLTTGETGVATTAATPSDDAAAAGSTTGSTPTTDPTGLPPTRGSAAGTSPTSRTTSRTAPPGGIATPAATPTPALPAPGSESPDDESTTAPTPGSSAAAPSDTGAAPTTPARLPVVPGRYIVTMVKPSLASYAGGIDGIAATRPEAGTRVETASDNARRYTAVLTSDQDAAAAVVGVKPATRFTVALNGFAVDLTPAQARRLTATPGVLAVSEDRMNYLHDDTSSTDFLALPGDNGTWAAVGGPDLAGKGVVIGVIDSGIWPENPSFAGSRLSDGPDPYHPEKPYRDGTVTKMTKADGQTFTGECQTGEQFTVAACTTKIISARYFGDAFFETTDGSTPNDFVSPRDADGHGSHTAGTAAGDTGVPVTVDGVHYGTISGVAPGASLAIYKALWQGSGDDAFGGADSDIIAAIEQAVIDGVDVLNYSAGRPTESGATDPVALAFLSAASAGIFVSASAGNDGPGSSTADNTQPWETTVAASTVGPREGTVELGDGEKFAGASTTVRTQLGPAPLLSGRLNPSATATPDAAAECAPGSLNPATVAGAIVQCDRGSVDRVVKSAEVARAGGIGMVLTDLVPGSTDADLHSVPTVHVDVPGGPAIQAYAATAGATATLLPGNDTGTATPYPQIAAFSSRGPALAAAGNILKPDIAAPGVSILAPVSPPGNKGRSWDFYSGTSMAAPQIAGLAAIYTAQFPEWSPMAIKSALMTTSYNTRNADGTDNTDPFAQGAGEVDPRRMTAPGLVYDAGSADWLGYLEGLGVDTQTGTAPIAASDYNQASIAVGAVLGPTVITRRVTAIAPGSYRATIAVPGFDAVVAPADLTFAAAGEIAQFTVTLTPTTAIAGRYATGNLTWTGPGTTVRSPIAVNAAAVGNAPAQVELGGYSDAASWTVTSGITGAFPTTTFGMAGGHPQPGKVAENAVQQYVVDVPAGTKLARFSTELADPNSDAQLDLSVAYQPVGQPAVDVGTFGSNGAENFKDVRDPQPGRYVVQVVGLFAADGTNATNYTYRHYLVEPTHDGDPAALTISPSGVTTTAGSVVSMTATAGGLDRNQSYLGWVQYVDGTGTLVVAAAGR